MSTTKQAPTSRELESEKAQAKEKLEAENQRLVEKQKQEQERANAENKIVNILEENGMAMGDSIFNISSYVFSLLHSAVRIMNLIF